MILGIQISWYRQIPSYNILQITIILSSLILTHKSLAWWWISFSLLMDVNGVYEVLKAKNMAQGSALFPNYYSKKNHRSPKQAGGYNISEQGYIIHVTVIVFSSQHCKKILRSSTMVCWFQSPVTYPPVIKYGLLENHPFGSKWCPHGDPVSIGYVKTKACLI